MVRTATYNKPYSRPDTHRRGNPDAPGHWKHDLHAAGSSFSSSSSLAARISGSSSGRQPALLSRISGGKGKELLPSSSSSAAASSANNGMYGYGATPPANPNNANAGVELLPSGGGPVRRKAGPLSSATLEPGRRSLFAAALGGGGGGRRREQRRELIPTPVASYERVEVRTGGGGGGVSIMGKARGTTWVRVENLAAGTTPEDVISAFAPVEIMNAQLTSPPSGPTATIEIEVASRTDAESIVQQYNGVVADGNTLKVAVVQQTLRERMGNGGAPAAVQPRVEGGGGLSARLGDGRRQVGEELLPRPSESKLYSDTILASTPAAAIITVQQSQEASQRARADAWMRGGPSLSDRIGGGPLSGRIGMNKRGRGQIGGGSFADMMVD